MEYQLRYNDLENNDDILYHYTKLRTGIECIIQKMELRFSPLVYTNDPREYKEIQFYLKPNSNDKFDDQVSHFHCFVQPAISGIRKNASKVACFCINSDERLGCFKPRMWAQYGDNHEGLCFVFSKRKLIEIAHEIRKNKNDFIFFDKIEYVKKLQLEFDLNHDNIKNGLIKNEKEVYYKILEERKKELYFKKDIDFKDESEFRIIIIMKSEADKAVKRNKFLLNNIDLPYKNALKGIIFGEKTGVIYNNILDDFCQKHKVKYARVYHQSDGIYTLAPI